MSKSAELPTRILFIGNSFTARNSMPELLAQLAVARGKHIEHALLSIGEDAGKEAEDLNPSLSRTLTENKSGGGVMENG